MRAEPNQPPTGQFTSSVTAGTSPLTVHFDATASTDTDGYVAHYFWDFGDGNTGSGPAPFHIYQPGTFTPYLVVVDDSGTATAITGDAIVVTGPGMTKPALTWPAPAPITYGTALSASQLDATANVPGLFAYSPAAGTVLGAGTHELSVIFTPTDTTHYTSVSATVTLQVEKADPVLTWAAPGVILYGTELSSDQLDATSSVAGTFAYTPTAGTVLQPGSHTLTASFTPTDTADYNTGSIATDLVIGFSAPCITTTETGSFTVARGESICLAEGGKLAGPVRVESGGSLWANVGTIAGPLTVAPSGRLWMSDGSITGPLTTTDATAVTICGTRATGPVTITGSTGEVLIGDATCTGNTFIGPVTVAANTGGVSFSANTVIGPLRIDSNSGGFEYVGNTVIGPARLSGNT